MEIQAPWENETLENFWQLKKFLFIYFLNKVVDVGYQIATVVRIRQVHSQERHDSFKYQYNVSKNPSLLFIFKKKF